MTDSKTATERLREMLDARGVRYEKPEDDSTVYYDEGKRYTYSTNPESGWAQLFGYHLTPEQAIAATLWSDASAVRLAEKLRGIADEMRNVGASSMKQHELLACYAAEVDKMADLMKYAATLGSEHDRKLLAEVEREIVILSDKLRIANETGAKTCVKCGTFLSDELLCTSCAATLESGECEMEETERYSNANEVIHVLECSACGRTCEHVNGAYTHCPHCGAHVRKAVKR